MMDVIDGYCHCGLSKYRPREDVAKMMERFGVARAVLVQHLGEFDNSYIQRVVEAEPDRFAGVFLVNTDDRAAAEQLARWARTGAFRGIRLLAHTLRTYPHLWEQAAELRLNLVVFDPTAIAPYANLLADFARAHPATRLILSHLGIPDARQTPDFPAHGAIFTLANQPNVFIQASGFHVFAEPPYEQLLPLMKRLLHRFGPDRLFYGSNYPSMKEPDITYERELDLIRSGKLGIPGDATGQVLSKTAMNLWFNDPPYP